MNTPRHLLALCAAACLLGTARAEPPKYTIKQIAATFIEPPPGRQQVLAPISAGNTMERVETTFVVTFQNRILANAPFFGDKSRVEASAIVDGGQAVPLGPASAMRLMGRSGDDGRSASVTVAVSRLPDKPAKGVRFVGTWAVDVAAASTPYSVKLAPKPGAAFKIGTLDAKVAEVDGNSMTLLGGEGLSRVHAIKLVRADGGTATGERTSYGSRGGDGGMEVYTQWRFSGPLSAGSFEFRVYKDQETLQLPLDLLVAKPY